MPPSDNGIARQEIRVVSYDADGNVIESGAPASPVAAFEALISNLTQFFSGMMNHVESANRTILRANELQQNELTAMRQARAEDTKSYIEMRRLIEEMQNDSEDRRIKREQHEQQTKIVNELVADGKPLLDLVVKSLLGVKVTDGAPDTVKKFLAGIRPEQIDLENRTIRFTEDQLATLVAIFGDYAQAEEADNAGPH